MRRCIRSRPSGGFLRSTLPPPEKAATQSSAPPAGFSHTRTCFIANNSLGCRRPGKSPY